MRRAMITSVLPLLLASTLAAQDFTKQEDVDRQRAEIERVATGPVEFTVQPLDFEQALGLLMNVCVRSGWQREAVEQAVESSGLAFEKTGSYGALIEWWGQFGVVKFSLVPTTAGSTIATPKGYCSLTAASRQERTRADILRMLQLLVGSELEVEVSWLRDMNQLAWIDPGSDLQVRLSVGGKDDQPSQEISLVVRMWEGSELRRQEALYEANRLKRAKQTETRF